MNQDQGDRKGWSSSAGGLHRGRVVGKHRLKSLYIPRDPARSRSLATPSSPVSAFEPSLWPPRSVECGSAQQDFSPQALTHRPASDWSVTRRFSHRESPGHCGSRDFKIHFCSCAAMPARRRPTGEPRRLVSCLLNVVRNGFINGFLNVVPK